ncbi:MAG: hypothetical protein Q9224_002790, partial [Gallowayella concinna]
LRVLTASVDEEVLWKQWDHKLSVSTLTKMTAQLRSIWSEVLDLDVDDIHDNGNFFELGGDSVAGIRLVTAALEANIHLDADVVFRYPKLMDMSAKCIVSKSKPTDTTNHLDPAVVLSCAKQCAVPADVVEDVHPSTPPQVRLLKLHIGAEEPGVLVEFVVIEIEGTQDTSRIQAAFELIHKRNAILRTRFVEIVDHGSKQVVINEPIAWGTSNDLLAYLTQQKSTPFAFGKPLARYGIVKQNDKTYVVWTAQHSIQDEWSRKLLFDDLETYLSTADSGHPDIPTRPSTHAFVDYQASVMTKAIEFWNGYLDGIKVESNILTFPPGYIPTLNPHATISERLQSRQKAKEGVSVPIMAYAAFALCLYSLSDPPKPREVIFVTTRIGRQIPVKGILATMGQIFSLILLRVPFHKHNSIKSLLQQIESDILDMMPYEHWAPAVFSPTKASMKLPLLNWHPQGAGTFSRVIVYEKEGNKVRLKPDRKLSGVLAVDQHALYVNGGSGEDIEVSFDEQVIEEAMVRRILELFIGFLGDLMGMEGYEGTIEEFLARGG